MTDWIARARTQFSKKSTEGTDRTDETGVSSPSSVAPARFYEKRGEVSSVSSVGVAPFCENAALVRAINRTCDLRGDDATNRAALIAECQALPPEGQADMLAHFTIEGARWQSACRGVSP